MQEHGASSKSSAEPVAGILRQFDELEEADQNALITALVKRAGIQRILSLVSICVKARIEEIRAR